jgi:hypothetical protein
MLRFRNVRRLMYTEQKIRNRNVTNDVPLYARAIRPLFFVILHKVGLVWHVDENPVHVDG